jgi:hypothetical protein
MTIAETTRSIIDRYKEVPAQRSMLVGFPASTEAVRDT